MKMNKKYWQNLSDSQKDKIKNAVKTIITAISIIIATIFGLSSCNVVRTITNESSMYQRGDTAVVITTKTIEQYNAKKQ